MLHFFQAQRAPMAHRRSPLLTAMVLAAAVAVSGCAGMDRQSASSFNETPYRIAGPMVAKAPPALDCNDGIAGVVDACNGYAWSDRR